ncbi:energy transducer TonB [Nannocystis sp. SCPEA4]|uniref:energy transducer TonB n=1 Tax=Nannocystis sp. SCPEA4 TaxID=2996787 RepID=UPI0022705CA5|nr:energy transducer TonB [Nannocystis sp. SCPEA4]MCY1056039.1 energy transducer TonB [Nannocystis sp. SCPEA4]
MLRRIAFILALVPLACATARSRPPGIRDMPAAVTVPMNPCPGVANGEVEGTVVLAVLVGSSGKVESVRIEHDIGGGCGEIAAAALREAVFRPAIADDGRAVGLEIRYQYEFRREN